MIRWFIDKIADLCCIYVAKFNCKCFCFFCEHKGYCDKSVFQDRQKIWGLIPFRGTSHHARYIYLKELLMMKGTPGEWFSNEYIGGYFDKNGELVVCEEYGLADFDTDKYAVEVQNNDGFYTEFGKYVQF